MRDLAQIVKDNGGDNTPAGDSHNLTGRAERTNLPSNAEYRDGFKWTAPKGVEPKWVPLEPYVHECLDCDPNECCLDR